MSFQASNAHGDSDPALRHQGDFARFLRSNQALIVTAIAEIFPGSTTGKIGWLQADDNDEPIHEPWRYVSALILADSADSSPHSCALGWILAADWALRLMPEIRLEQSARETITVIANGGWKSALVEQSKWDLFQSYLSTFSVRERISDNINGKECRDPRNNVSLQPIPWLGELGANISAKYDPLKAIHNNAATDLIFHGTKLVAVNGDISIFWPANNHTHELLVHVNEFIPKPSSVPLHGQVNIRSPRLSFRVHRTLLLNDEARTHLRCVSGRPPNINLSSN